MVFRRFVHLPVLSIEKYQNGENRVDFKSPDICLKKPRTFFKRIPKFASLGEKSPKQSLYFLHFKMKTKILKFKSL
jgi:hypothetical protein